MTEYDRKAKTHIIAKMNEQSAVSLHDLEITRSLRKCVMGTKLIEEAKRLRDEGKITNSDLRLG